VAQALGLARLEGVPAIQVEAQAGAGLSLGLTAFRPDLLGYLWLFPKGATANLGLGGESLGSATLPEMLDQWRAELLAEGLIGPSIFRRNGGFIPVAGPRPEVVLEGPAGPVILCGDAAGLTNPLTGAGIPQAVQSGRQAGAAAAGFVQGRPEALAGYTTWLRETWAGPLQRALARRARAEALWTGDFLAGVKAYWPLWPRRAR
jgi:flavin-dependent dehydrogenase